MPRQEKAGMPRQEKVGMPSRAIPSWPVQSVSRVPVNRRCRHEQRSRAVLHEPSSNNIAAHFNRAIGRRPLNAASHLARCARVREMVEADGRWCRMMDCAGYGVPNGSCRPSQTCESTIATEKTSARPDRKDIAALDVAIALCCERSLLVHLRRRRRQRPRQRLRRSERPLLIVMLQQSSNIVRWRRRADDSGSEEGKNL